MVIFGAIFSAWVPESLLGFQKFNFQDLEWLTANTFVLYGTPLFLHRTISEQARAYLEQILFPTSLSAFFFSLCAHIIFTLDASHKVVKLNFISILLEVSRVPIRDHLIFPYFLHHGFISRSFQH